MKKITIEFQSENSTEFKVNVGGATYRELLVLARELPKSSVSTLDGDGTKIEIYRYDDGYFDVHSTRSVTNWQIQLVADEFYLAAQHIFFTQQNEIMMRAAQERQANQIAIAKLQQGGRGNSNLIYPGG
jgi:hypothetical protein